MTGEREADSRFMATLRVVYERAGKPSARSISRALGDVSHTTVAELLSGRRIPSRSIVERVVLHLGGNADTLKNLYKSTTSNPLTRIRSIANLLRPEAEVVRFRGRSSELADLAAWCTGPGLRVRLVTGPGGQGKTRLARELVRRLDLDPDARWLTLWWATLKGRAAEERVEALAGLNRSALVVMDYVETRPDEVADVIRAATAAGTAGALVRVLLLARSAGDWWQRLIANNADLEPVLYEALVDELGPLEESPAGREVAFSEALNDLATALDAIGWPHHPPGRVTVPDLNTSRFTGAGAALTLQMTALAGLLEGGPSPDRTAEQVILSHESRFWGDSAAHCGLHVSDHSQRRAVALASLCGAADEPEAVALLALVPGFTDQPEDVRLTAARWLRDLYPPDPAPPRTWSVGTSRRPASSARAPFWGSLQPDRLVERMIAELVRDRPDVLPALAVSTSPAQGFQALTVLARAAVTYPDIASEVTAMVTSHPALAATAIQVAVQSEDPSALVAALSAVAVDEDLPVESLAALADTIPHQTRALAAFAVTIANALAERRERLAAANPDAYLPDLAISLNNLAVRLGDLGRREEALAAIEEAVQIRRTLAQTHPDAFLPDLASSLNNQSAYLSGLGRREEALTAIEEAVQIRRTLAQTHPDAFLPNLASSLNNYSNRLSNLGRRGEALTAIEEASTIYRTLAQTHPDAFLPNLAMSLNNHSNRLSNLGRREEALTAIEEAVQIRRTLAQTHPDAFLPDLASSLNNQSTCLSGLGRRGEALTAIEEASTIYRTLAQTHPDAFLPDLATSLAVKGMVLLRDGDAVEAVPFLLDSLMIAVERNLEELIQAVAGLLREAYQHNPGGVAQAWREITESDSPDWLADA